MAFFVNAATKPVDASNDFLALAQADNGAAAYDALAPLCQTNNRPAFEALINDLNVTGYDLNGVAINNSSGAGTAAVVTGTITLDGAAQSAQLDLQEIDGTWRVCMFILGQTVYNGS